ncbi:MAG: hypothetical protein R3B70_30850 [Polyangiaceae bacterium]
MFRVRKEQMAAFESLFRRRFERELAEHLWAELSRQSAALGEERVREVVSWAIDHGKEYGFVTEQQVCLFATAALMLGPDFESRRETQWAKMVLESPDYLYPDRRLTALFAAMERRLSDDEDGGGAGDGEDDGEERGE